MKKIFKSFNIKKSTITKEYVLFMAIVAIIITYTTAVLASVGVTTDDYDTASLDNIVEIVDTKVTYPNLAKIQEPTRQLSTDESGRKFEVPVTKPVIVETKSEDVKPPVMDDSPVVHIDSIIANQPGTERFYNQLDNMGLGVDTTEPIIRMRTALKDYEGLIVKYANKHSTEQYVIPVDWVERIIYRESRGDTYCDTGSARGLGNIESTLYPEFRDYGVNMYGQTWTRDDLFNAEKSIDFICYRLSVLLERYNGDYLKSTQAYNYSEYSLDKLIKAYGSGWYNNRHMMASLNGRSSYGDPKYIEHVMCIN